MLAPGLASRGSARGSDPAPSRLICTTICSSVTSLGSHAAALRAGLAGARLGTGLVPARLAARRIPPLSVSVSASKRRDVDGSSAGSKQPGGGDVLSSSAAAVLRQLSEAPTLEEVARLSSLYPASASPVGSLLAVAQLEAAARCRGAGDGDLSPKEERLLKDLVPRLLRELAPRAPLLSLQQLCTALTALAALLPATSPSQPPAEVEALVAALPAGTRAATPGTKLPGLAAALATARRIYGAAGLPLAACQKLEVYARGEVLGGSTVALSSLRREASMRELAAAVRIAAELGLSQPPAFVEAVGARADELMAAAVGAAEQQAPTAAQPPRAPAGGTTPPVGQKQQKSAVPGASKAAAKQKQPGGPSASGQAKAVGRQAQKSKPLAAGVQTGPLEQLDGAKSASEFDVSALAALVQCWCEAPPSPALAALARMPVPPPQRFVESALGILQPHLASLSSTSAAVLLRALAVMGPEGRGGAVDMRPLLGPLLKSAGESAAAGRVPLAMLASLLQTCAAWGVQVPAATLTSIEKRLERQVRAEMGLFPDLGASLNASKRFIVETAGAQQPAHGNGGSTVLEGLMEGVVLPLAQLGQAFASYEVYGAALHAWRAGGFPGLTAAKAAAALRMVAAAPGWAHVPQLRRDLEQLLVAALGPAAEPSSGLGPEPLAELLLASARALRVMAAKVQRKAGMEEDAAPSAAPLLPKAAERLLALQPEPEALAAAMRALFLELEWATPGQQGPQQEQQRGFLARLVNHLDATLPELASIAAGYSRSSGISLLGVTAVLAACARCQHPPPLGLLGRLYASAVDSLEGDSPNGRPPSASLLVSLVVSMQGIGPLAEQAGDIHTARDRMALLRATLAALTREDVLGRLQGRELTEAALAVRQLALMGAAPPDGWAEAYVPVLRDRLPHFASADGLSAAAMGAALLGAAPPPSFVGALLAAAERLLQPPTAGRGGSPTSGATSWQRYPPYELGLLLGAAHGLLSAGAAGRDPKGPVASLSTAAQTAWGRAHATFVQNVTSVMPRYSACPAELRLVVAAVASFELRRPYTAAKAGGAKAAVGGKAAAGKTPTKAKASNGASGAASPRTAVDYMGGVKADWIAFASSALLQARTRSLQQQQQQPWQPPAEPLPPSLLLDLLRLASRVVAESADGSIRPIFAATTPEAELKDLNELVTLSLEDWTVGGRYTPSFPPFLVPGGGDGRKGRSGTKRQRPQPKLLSAAEWQPLLSGVLDAGIRPSGDTLQAFTSSVLVDVFPAADSQDTSAADATELWPKLEVLCSGVLLRALPWSPSPGTASSWAVKLEAVPLQPASARQLALLSTYCCQAGLGGQAWAVRLGAELERRAEGAQAGSGHGSTAAAADVAAVIYAVVAADACPCAAAKAWLQRLEAQERASQGPLEQGWASDLGPELAALSALQRLWVAHTHPSGAVGPDWSLLAPAFGSPVALSLLRPPQLAQLTRLAAAAAEAPLPPAVAAELLQRLAGCRAEVGPEVAMLALRHLLPAADAASGQLGPDALPTAGAALAKTVQTALPAMPLGQAEVLLQAVQGGAGWVLSRASLTGLLDRVRRGNDPDWSGWTPQQRLRFATALVAATAAATSAGGDAPLLTLALLLQDVLLPSPEAERWLQATALGDRLPEAVLGAAAGAQGIAHFELSAVLGSGTAVGLAAAVAAADTTAAAVEALLLKRLGPGAQPAGPGVGQVASGPELGAEDAAALLSALVALSGERPLPRPLAALALWLLGREGVVERVPLPQLRTAVSHSLAGHEGLPMGGATAEALFVRLSPTLGGSQGTAAKVELAVHLVRSGAPPAFARQALFEAARRGDFGQGISGIKTYLQAACGAELQEHPRCTAWVDEGPITAALRPAFHTLVSRSWSNLTSAEELADGAQALAAASALAVRLGNGQALWPKEGEELLLESGAVGGRNLVRFKRGWMQPSVNVDNGNATNRQHMWELLEQLCALGPMAVSAFHCRATLRLMAAGSDDFVSFGGRIKAWERESAVWDGEVMKAGAYFVGYGAAISILKVLTPEIAADLDAYKAANGLQALFGGGSDGGKLSARQLGQLYGMLVMRRDWVDPSDLDILSGLTFAEVMVRMSSEPLRTAVWALYEDRLRRLLKLKGTLPNLDYLTAALDALEPAVCGLAPDRDESPEYWDEFMALLAQLLEAGVRPLLFYVEPLRPAPTLGQRLDAAGALVEEGMEAAPFDAALVLSPRPLSERDLLDDLYWPPGTPGRLYLPPRLRPPPGLRHGWGDPEGDAAREAYVLEVAPWLLAARRLVVVCMASKRIDSAGELEMHAGALSDGASRWGRLFRSVLRAVERAPRGVVRGAW
ncbi:hypothetical protein HYH03_005622 [Edaphochlamys debaryana]|uniref:Uncharacterized protein n=1 Tax=Edaphochlamys debaryana TaxID=47281 RepID=A0A835Y599_9CHLO|nr:hypothetical protein HYH03_005622 [Edaphochlamys debaryana]|eukprot:KAG2496395.1 hypothetical protein HYH03_005622 [Edaphochlamys debaryana]